MFTLFKDKTTVMLESAALTHRGQKREVNQDAVFHQSNDQRGLYMVCDGLGGHQAGDKASRWVIDIMTAELGRLLFDNEGVDKLSSTNLSEAVRSAVLKAEARLKDHMQTHPEVHRMGTTLTLALVNEKAALIANMGDSRAYLYRDGYVTQLTEDHSWAAALARMGKIREDEVADHPRSNMLYRSLGMEHESDSAVDIFEQDLEPGDKLLLCSDGLWHTFSNATKLAEWLDASGEPEQVAEHLVDEANRRDGSDNISAVVVQITE